MKSNPHFILKMSCVAGGANHPAIDRCLGFMAQNFHQPIQLHDLVIVSGMSRRGFCNAFHRCLGANPGAFLRQLRIEHAKRLLTEYDLLLKQVARQCGFRSENTFCVAFQQATKTSPKKFQREYWLAIYRNRQTGENPAMMANDVFAPTTDGNARVRFDNATAF